MKIRLFSLLLTAALLLPGCAADALESNLDAAEDAVEQKLDAAEDRVENALTPSSEAALTHQQARDIALSHAGFTADQVTNLRTVFEVDDGVPQYEVDFHQGQWEYEYEINANTGEIMTMDKDD